MSSSLIVQPPGPRVNTRKNLAQRALEVGPRFHFPEADFEILLSMIKLDDRRFRPTMKRISAAIEAAGAKDINERLAEELHVTRKQAGALLRALVAIGGGDAR
jgi:hypothetical protein